MLITSFGYSKIEIKMYKSGTNDGQSANETIWEVKAFRSDVRGDRYIDFQEATFELFIKNLSKLLWQLN